MMSASSGTIAASIEVVTPLHVGDGRGALIHDVDFLIHRGQIVFIDQQKLWARLGEERLARWNEPEFKLSALLQPDEYEDCASAIVPMTGHLEATGGLIGLIADVEGRPYLLLLANIGNRDVTLDEKPVHPARIGGAKILAELATSRQLVDLPLLRPTLAYLERAGTPPDQIILFATDQPAGEEPGHRDSDTVHFAAIAKKIIEEPPRSGKKASYAGKVSIRRLEEENPSLYDETFSFYQKALARIKGGADARDIFVLASGGTPAMNLGLLVAAIERYGDRCKPLYLEAGAAEPRRLDLVRQLQESTLRRVATSHVAKYQFAAAREVFDDMGDVAKNWRPLADYATARLNFDWKGAWAIADRALVAHNLDFRRLYERLRDEAHGLAEKAGDRSLFLGERYHRARVAWENGAYSEFLGLLVALEEALLRSVARKELEIDFDRDDYDARQVREGQVASRPDLGEYLRSIQVGGNPLTYTASNRVSLLAYVEYLVQTPGIAEEPQAEQLREFQRLVIRIDEGPARDRNRAIHGDGGASRESIEKSYLTDGAPGPLMSDLERATELAGGRVKDWAIDAIRQRLLTELGP